MVQENILQYSYFFYWLQSLEVDFTSVLPQWPDRICLSFLDVSAEYNIHIYMWTNEWKSTVIFTQMSHQIFGRESPLRSIHFGALALAEVTSMSAQFIICRPLTLLVFGPRIRKAHSQARWKKKKKKAEHGARVEYSIRGWEREEKWSCVPVLHLTLLISC